MNLKKKNIFNWEFKQKENGNKSIKLINIKDKKINIKIWIEFSDLLIFEKSILIKLRKKVFIVKNLLLRIKGVFKNIIFNKKKKKKKKI